MLEFIAHHGAAAEARALYALDQVLVDEERAMERVCRRAESLALRAASGDLGLLPIAVDELADALEAVGSIELRRALIVADLGMIWGVPDTDLSLPEIIAHAGEHEAMLKPHLQALRRQTAALDQLVDKAKRVVIEQLRTTRAEARLAPSLSDAGY